jgi:FkbM family methyltransferase
VRLDLPGVPPLRMWSGEDWLTSRVWWRGIDGFEPEVVRPFLHFAASARAVLDVGAYTGYYALLAARLNPSARILAFEPNPAVTARLSANLLLNPDLGLTVLPYAVGAERAVVEFHVGGPGLASSSSLSQRWEGRHRSIPVAVVDLDSIVAEWGVGAVDLVKIDVESQEPSVVDGMTRLLESDRPVIFTEVLGGAKEDYARMAATLQRADYRFFRLLHDGTAREERGLQEAGRPAAGRRAMNHLLCPRERVPSWLAEGRGAP